MQLRVARLCLDCEDVHDGQQCPVCASETFAYLTRWVPAPERRTNPRPADAVDQPAPPAAPRPPSSGPSKKKLVGYSVLGVGLVGLAEWFLRGRARIEAAAERSNSGELR
jgi:hypothetical protein